MFQDGLQLGKLEHAQVIRLGESEFLDLPVYAGPDDSMHLILRIRYGDKTFALDSIRPEFLTQHPNKLKHEFAEWLAGQAYYDNMPRLRICVNSYAKTPIMNLFGNAVIVLTRDHSSDDIS